MNVLSTSKESIPPKYNPTIKRRQERKVKKSLNEEMLNSRVNYAKYTQRFNNNTQARNNVINKVSTQKKLPKERCYIGLKKLKRD